MTRTFKKLEHEKAPVLVFLHPFLFLKKNHFDHRILEMFPHLFVCFDNTSTGVKSCVFLFIPVYSLYVLRCK